VALILVIASACATVPSRPVEDVTALKGSWRGWIITPREFVPALLEVEPDGTFVMSGVREPVTRVVTGTFYVKDGVTSHGRRTLTTEREDRRFPARFHGP
jgi:hypothetical protein